jgi:hypothetical protein
MVAGFIATLKVAVTVPFGQATAPLSGVTEVALGGVKSGLAPELQHPVVRMSSRNAGNQILKLQYLLMTFILLLPATERPQLPDSISQTNSRAVTNTRISLIPNGPVLAGASRFGN